ncbi:MAG: DUF6537 domain-containing protein, partial [Kiloniellales bacterium]|nr:DUF6537 domain-containing protein [Kiloniellales bacterium]
EYEVARLYSEPEFRRKLEQQFAGDYRLKLNLAPPLLAERDAESGHLKKRAFGPWIFTVLKGLQHLKTLRNTPFDPFGYTKERRRERALITRYETVIEEIVRDLSNENYEQAVALASLPDSIRGYGHIKEQAITAAAAREAQLLESFRHPETAQAAAE